MNQRRENKDEPPLCGWRPWNYTESQSLSWDYAYPAKWMLIQS